MPISVGYVRLGMRPQLDALRCLAVFAVLFSHYLAPDTPAGERGVDLFFTISGFLITSILLEARAGAEQRGRGALSRAWRSFVIRRALRIFPAYYVVIAGAAVLSEGAAAAWAWHATFLTNFWQSVDGGWGPRSVAHCWSLCVEEQFYLLWPMVVLFLPRRCLLPIVCLLMLSGFEWKEGWALERLAAFGVHAPDFYMTLPPRAFPTLGLGALMAWSHHRGVGFPDPRPLASAAALAWLGLDGCGVLVGLPSALVAFASLVSGGVLLAAGVRGRLGVAADVSSVRYLGRISYGIYLYHMPVLAVVLRVVRGSGVGSTLEAGVVALASTLVTVAVAAASWRFFEAPINRWKARFPYVAG